MAQTSPQLVVYTDFSYRESGSVTAELPFVLFLNALAAEEVSVTVVGRLDPSPDPFPFALDPSIEFVGLPAYDSLANPAAVVRVAARTMRRFATGTADADAVWLFGPHPFAFFFAAIAAWRRQALALGVRQDMPALIARRHPGKPWIRWAARILEGSFRLLSRRCATLVVGPALAEKYRSARRLINLPISLVNASEIADPTSAKARSYDGDLTAVSVGRLDPEKNPLLLADVLRVLRERDPRWRLDIYGDGPVSRELEEKIKAFGLAESATLHGFVPVDQGLGDVYRAAHALLHVSWTEGVPQVLFEAFAAGLPIAATGVGGVAEAVDGAALLSPPGEPELSADALETIARDKGTRDALIDAGIRRVSGMTVERQARRALDFIFDAR